MQDGDRYTRMEDLDLVLSDAISNLKCILPGLRKLAIQTFIDPIPHRLLENNTLTEVAKHNSLSELSSIQLTKLAEFDPFFSVAADVKGIGHTMQLDISEFSGFTFIQDEEFNSLPEYNWLGFLSVTARQKIYDDWKAGQGKDSKTFLREGFSEEETMDGLVQWFSNNQLFIPRMRIIKDALNAHLEQRYTLSIPVILSQIDGIFIEKHRDLKGTITTNKCKECGNKNKGPLNAGHISRYLANKASNYMGDFLSHINDTFGRIRNDILHGKKLDYPDEDLSIKLILTLLGLYYSTREQSSATGRI